MEGWPAAPEPLRAARAVLGTPARGPSVVACDRDVDGLAAAVLTQRALERLDGRPVASTSLLAFELLRPLVALDDLAWLAVLGTVADLGVAAPFPAVRAWLARHGRREVTEAVALLNAARRAAGDEVEVALGVLERAADPGAIAGGRIASVERLRACRCAVDAETRRCARTRPVFAGRYALLRCASAMQVHPLVAVRWMRRLRGLVVIAANDGYLLRSLPLGIVDGEYGYGHPAATGGSLPPADFARLLEALGFPDRAAAGPARADAARG